MTNGFGHPKSLLAPRAWLAAGAVIAIVASLRLSYGDTIQSIPFEENRRTPITRDDLVGEWSGLTAEQEALVTLRVDRTGKKVFFGPCTPHRRYRLDANLQVQRHPDS